ncbi:MAG: undecaprenyldiphospho-muramoylpentapeptide beta-N-acetylglucosaminyltransferase [Prolixibacteraceae bacterium]|nr:undecaprenyldiphospho-muramoylpentapeptide beta-N-acetylglucosaminyltransferase [Prolixibacteraceae bacterium]
MNIERVIISGGGTGGHIFPALSIANEISKRNPDSEILFVGALGRMEMEKVPAAGYKIIGLPVTGLPRRPGIKMIRFTVQLLKSYRLSQKIVRQFKPQIVVGVGGFASGPLLRVAARKRIPYLIQEQNSFAGITNKLLGGKAGVICVAFEKMDRYFPAEKIVITGNPVRESLFNITVDKSEAIEHFGLSYGEKVLLITGGSLGARSVNDAVINNMDRIAACGTEIIWQAGSIYFKEMQEKIQRNKPANLHLVEFISRMDLAYIIATVVISRAGAGTIAELCMAGKPAILVPSPNVAEDHQTKNALALVEKGAAKLIPDKNINERLIVEALQLIDNHEECNKLSEEIKKLARPYATRHIVDEAEKLLK